MSERRGAGTGGEAAVLRPEELDAVLFDMDGVLTDTSGVHFRAWKETLDDFLRGRREEAGVPFEPFTRNDHRRHVAGKARYEGARDFLRARGIELPFGEPDDPPERQSVCGLGNRKNERYLELLADGALEAFGHAERAVRRLRAAGVKTAVASSSRNAGPVLEAAGLAGLFDAVVDGTTLADDPALTGKPAPDLFLEAARRVGAAPERTVVVEDSRAGVEAARRGEFRLVIGLCRERDPSRLEDAGAHLVVRDLGEVPIASGHGHQAARDEPRADDPT